LEIDRETPRLTPQPPPLELVAEEIEDLATKVTRQRARMDRMLALPLEERAALIPGCSNDNGDDRDH
jgi:hypothetical protein